MKAVVVDTNVLMIAGSPLAGPAVSSLSGGPDSRWECIRACLGLLQEIKQGTVICVDAGWLILREYRSQPALRAGQGVGAQFLRWLLQRRADPRHCELVTITVRGDDGRDFMEFPDAPELATFDPSDRKFVAVARASSMSPSVAYASDRGWTRHRDALARHGVALRPLCPVADR